MITELPIIVFRRNRNLQDILSKKPIVNNRKELCQSIDQILIVIRSHPKNLCCTQVQSKNTFRSTVTHKAFKICIKLNCESKYLVLLMECVFCNKQDTGKSETTFNLSLNNHWKDVNRHKSLQDEQHFRLPGHKFIKHSQFIIIEQLNETNIE